MDSSTTTSMFYVQYYATKDIHALRDARCRGLNHTPTPRTTVAAGLSMPATRGGTGVGAVRDVTVVRGLSSLRPQVATTAW